MNNIKKIGLTALAGSLVTLGSAQQAKCLFLVVLTLL